MPPPSTCPLPAPWQFSQVTPAALPCIRAILVCGLAANFLATSSWQVAQVSLPTKSVGAASLVWAGAGLSPGAWAGNTGTHNILAPSNIKQARSPGLLPGAALIGNCVTGPSLCIEKYRLGCSHEQ